MLSNSLENVYYDGKHYDARYSNYNFDLEFYFKSTSDAGGRVIELMSGTGRLTIPLFEKGIDITGLDASANMIQQAKRKARIKGLHILFIQRDVRGFEIEFKADQVIIPCSSICHFYSHNEFRACLHSIHKCLTNDCRLIFDLIYPDLTPFLNGESKRRKTVKYNCPSGTGIIVITGKQSYSHDTQILYDHLSYHFPGDTQQSIIRKSRLYLPEEIECILQETGFKVLNMYGDFNYGILSKESNHIVVVSQAIQRN